MHNECIYVYKWKLHIYFDPFVAAVCMHDDNIIIIRALWADVFERLNIRDPQPFVLDAKSKIVEHCRYVNTIMNYNSYITRVNIRITRGPGTQSLRQSDIFFLENNLLFLYSYFIIVFKYFTRYIYYNTSSVSYDRFFEFKRNKMFYNNRYMRTSVYL